MTLLFSGSDAIREFFSGASSDGQFQDQQALCLGNFRSSFEAFSFGISIASALQGVNIQCASGANAPGIGVLLSQDGVSLQWQAPGFQVPGAKTLFTPGQTTTLIVPGVNPSQFLRVAGTPPFTVGASSVTLTTLLQNVFGMDTVLSAVASAGASQYRATILQNLSGADVTMWSRWLQQLGTAQLSDQGQLGASGAGVIQSSGLLIDWPTTGWCQIRKADGTLREVVYYASRTIYTLTVPATGRSLLGSTAGAGLTSDSIHAVPGIAIALDPAGVQSAGSGISIITNQNTAPAGVTWNLELTQATGLQIARIGSGQLFGVWYWRQVPAGVVFSPNVYTQLSSDFFAYN